MPILHSQLIMTFLTVRKEKQHEMKYNCKVMYLYPYWVQHQHLKRYCIC